MDHNRGGFDPLQVADQVEIPQTFPYGLLHFAHDSERREVASLARIRKVTGDAKLERALAICRRILLPQPRSPQLLPLLLDLGALLPAIELRLECAPTRQSTRLTSSHSSH